MYRINMETSTPYEIIIKSDIYSYIDIELKEIYTKKRVYIITDERVGKLYLDKITNALKSFDIKSIVIKGYEESKSLNTYQEICSKLIELGITRGEMLLALGGGVIGDLVGFIASTLFRGVSFVQIPTSLLAQVDSSIGGKTGINLGEHKNFIGTFYQPKKVLIDPLFLKTLPQQEINNGYGEMIKHALIGSKKLYELLLISKDITEEIIYENLLVKKNKVILDEFDNGERMKLNYGHTFGHAIELINNIPHGIAVLSGILCITDFAIDKKIITSDIKTKILNLYKKCNLDILSYDYHLLLDKLKYDKKNFSGSINLIIVGEIGESFIYKYRGE